jgi:multisubunit Na+/H+ antiporter MnhE subunit
MPGRSKSPGARAARTATPAVVTWVALAAVWMLLVDNRSLPELLVGAGVACIATVGSELVRAQRIATVRFRLRWLPRLWRPLARVPLDVAIVMWALVGQLRERRAERGTLRALRFRALDKDLEHVGRRAAAELAGTLAPNTIVIGVDTRRRVILVHQLVRTGEGASTLDPLELG